MATTVDQIQPSIVLPACMDVVACGPIATTVLKQLNSQTRIGIDASALERVSTPGVQLLMSAIKTAENDGKRLVVLWASPALMQAVNDLGLSQHFHPYLDNRKAIQ